MPERYRIIGSAPAQSAMTTEAFRDHARQAVEQFGTSKPDGDAWDAFAAALSFGSADPDNTAPLTSAVQEAEKEIGGRPRRLFQLAIPPAAFESVVEMIARDGPRAAAPRHRREAVRPRPGLGARPEPPSCTPSSTSRRSSASTTSSARNRSRTSSRSGSPTACSSRSGTAQHVGYVQIDVPETLSIEGRAVVLRRDRRLPGHGRHAPVPGAGLRRDGAAVLARRRRRCAAEKTKVYEATPAASTCGTWSAASTRATGGEPGVPPDSQTETMVALAGRDRQLALGRRPVLPALGQVHGASRQMVTLGFHEPPLRMFRIERQRAVAAERARDRVSRSRLDLAALPRQGAGAGDRPPQATMTFRYDRSLHAGLARRVRAPVARRDARRPGPVHGLGRDRAAVGAVDAAPRQPLADPSVRARLVGAAARHGRLVAPRHWCLPDGH